jgi:Holliday junction DNA helicase RuvA
MITFLEGTLEESWPGRLVLNVGGVGYEVLVPLFGDEQFGQGGSKTRVLTHHHIREQEQTLYGFPDEDARDLFRLLINHVSGVGPKVAMSILSGMAASDFKEAVVRGDINTISKIRGLGKKTAERIVLELGDKVGVKDAWLGYKQVEAQKAIEKLPETLSKPDEILRAALRLLQG